MTHRYFGEGAAGHRKIEGNMRLVTDEKKTEIEGKRNIKLKTKTRDEAYILGEYRENIEA